jgi:hypothetical protein
MKVSLKATIAAVPVKYNVYSLLTGAVTGATVGVSKFSTGLSPNVRKLTIRNDPLNSGSGNVFIGDGNLAPTAGTPVYDTVLQTSDSETYQSSISDISLRDKWISVDTDDTVVDISFDK